MMKNYCSSIIAIFRRMDPAYDSLFSALYLTVPPLLAGFYSLYSLKPFSIDFVLLAAFMFLGIQTFSSYKDKLTYISVFLLLVALFQFIVNIFIAHPTVIIVCVFLIALPILAVDKIRSACLLALTQLALFLNGSWGWYDALNGIIEVVVMGIMVISCMMLFEYSFSKTRMRAHLLYLLELLADAFNIMIFPDKKTAETYLVNKHLLAIPLNYRADFLVEHLFSSKQHIFLHRLFTQLTKANRLIVNEDYYFQKNIAYRNRACLAYFQCRKLFREITFLTVYLNNEAEIQKLLPNTKALMSNINGSFKIIYKAIRTQESIEATLSDTITNQWLVDCEKLKKLCTATLDKEILEFIYGIKCLITDIRKFEEILKNHGDVRHE